MSRDSPEGVVRLLRAAALIAVAGAAVGSVGLMLRAGRHAPRLLVVLFTPWVLSPFIALVAATVLSKRWSAFTRTTLHAVMLVVALGSLAIYGDDALRPRRAQAAFVFVVVPAASWLLGVVVVATAAMISGRTRR